MSQAIFRDSVLLEGQALGQTYYRENRTEAYVCIPPALIITDSNGATWTIGIDYVTKWVAGGGLGGGYVYYWSVLRNDIPTGEYSERIEYRNGKVYIYPPSGRKKVWTERSTTKIQIAPGYWV